MKNSTSLPSTTSTSILSTSKPASTSTTVGPSTTPGVPNSAYSAMGCYTDSDVTARPLVGGYFPDAAQSIELCAANCKAFAYFGVEYGTECYCGSAIIDSSSPASDGRCSMPCAGSASEICGGSYGMNIFKYSSASTSSTVSTVPTGTSSTGTVSSSVSQTSVSSTSAPSGSSSPFISKGCWSDNDVTERTLIGGAYTDQAMTLQLCAADCKGFAYFGVEYGKSSLSMSFSYEDHMLISCQHRRRMLLRKHFRLYFRSHHGRSMQEAMWGRCYPDLWW